MHRFGWMVGVLLVATACGGSTAASSASSTADPSLNEGPVTATVESADAGTSDASMDARSDADPLAHATSPVDAGPPPPNRTKDYYLRWRFDPAPVPEGAEASYSHVILEVHSQSGVQEVDTEVTDANCHDDAEHLSRRGVLRAKCWFAGAGWEIDVTYRDATLIVRRRTIDSTVTRDPQWRAITRIAVPARSTLETPAGPYSR